MKPVLYAGLVAAALAAACSSQWSNLNTESGTTAIDNGSISPRAESLPDIVVGNDHYLPDFSYAGYKNGTAPLPAVTGTVFDVTDYGAIANDGLDDSKAVLAALAAANAHAGPVVVKFPAGRFIVSEIIYIERSDFALQGAGEETVLYYPRPMKFLPTPPQFSELAKYLLQFDKRQREPKNNIDLPFSLYSWSGGFIWAQTPGARGKAYLEEYDDFPAPLTAINQGRRGERVIQVVDTSNISAGDVLKVEWYNREGKDGSILTEMYGDRSRFKKLGGHHWNFPGRALVTQMTRIEAVNGNRLTLSDPLLMDANPAWQPKLVPWPHLENVSISDLSIDFPDGVSIAHHVEDGYNAMYLTGLFDSFVRNVHINNADSGILNDDNANLTIDSVTTTGEHRAHYTVHMGSVYNVLAQNIRVENRAQHPFSFNTYAVKSVYKDSEILVDGILDQHSGANHQNLFDNITVHVPVGADRTRYPLFSGGGAGYWKPSHGRFSTFFNINVQASGGDENAPLTLVGPKDGVEVRLLNIHGNRELAIEYGPDAHIEQLNQQPTVRSLYELQLQRRGA